MQPLGAELGLNRNGLWEVLAIDRKGWAEVHNRWARRGCARNCIRPGGCLAKVGSVDRTGDRFEGLVQTLRGGRLRFRYGLILVFKRQRSVELASCFPGMRLQAAYKRLVECEVAQHATPRDFLPVVHLGLEEEGGVGRGR